MKHYDVKYRTTGYLVRTVRVLAQDAYEAIEIVREDNGDLDETYSVKAASKLKRRYLGRDL